MWKLTTPTLLLASQSPRRLALLQHIGIPVQTLDLPPEADDEPELPDEDPVEYVIRTARDKNERAQEHVEEFERGLVTLPILSGDTIVVLDGRILGKPTTPFEATTFIEDLSGRTHDVYTAVHVSWEDKHAHVLSHTKIRFAALDKAVIHGYVATKEPFGKAGGYAIQGLAGAFVEHLDGSYTGTVGLPIHETVQLLRDMKLLRVAS